MSNVEKILFTALGLVLVMGSVWVFQGWYSERESRPITPPAATLNYDQAKQVEDPANPCEPPAGYTEESWREHMGHHPEQYQQCLGN